MHGSCGTIGPRTERWLGALNRSKAWPTVVTASQVQADAVPVEAQAGFEVADHHDGMMNASGHSTRG